MAVEIARPAGQLVGNEHRREQRIFVFEATPQVAPANTALGLDALSARRLCETSSQQIGYPCAGFHRASISGGHRAPRGTIIAANTLGPGLG